MAGVARIGDSISGMTTDTHHYHYENGAPIYDTDGTTIIGYQQVLVYDPAVPISGSISGNCSSNVYVNGAAVAKIGSTTSEQDAYDSGSGSVSGGSSSVFVNEIGISRNGDSVSPHNGTASVSGGSGNVFAN